MWVTGEAGMSNILNENITIERPLSEDFLEIEVEEIIVTPPGKIYRAKSINLV